MRGVIRIGLFITFCWVLSGNTAAAQESSAAPSKPSPTNPFPTPIPLAEVASQAQSAMESLRDIEDSLTADQTTTTIEKRLPQLTKEIDLRTAYHAKLLAASLPLELLHRMEGTLQIFRDELSTWIHDLTERAKTLDDQLARLDQLSKIWQSTLQLPELSQMPPEILKRVQSLIDSIGRTRRAVESRRAEVLTLLNRVLEWTERVQTTSSSIEQTQAKAVKNLFVPDSPPIWSWEIRNGIEGSRARALLARRRKRIG
jgi:chromosome segregation ATPase